MHGPPELTTSDVHEGTTVDSKMHRPPIGLGQTRVVCAILHHADPSRIGDEAVLGALGDDFDVEINRQKPTFWAPGDERVGFALGADNISRSPITVAHRGKRLTITCTKTRYDYVLGGRAAEQLACHVAALSDGIVIHARDRFALLLYTQRAALDAWRGPGDTELLGRSDVMAALRQRIAHAAQLPATQNVLITGESGSGKELVARALHRAGPAPDGPFVAVNMAAVAGGTMRSELFGHVRGAFSGATRDHAGFFERAMRGTIFLDEVGKAPPEVQDSLLRALETRRFKRLGDTRERRLEARVVAATDTNLEAAMESGTFAAPLYFRLAGLTIAVPALRERHEDVAGLLMHFLDRHQAALRGGAALAPRAQWLTSSLMVNLIGQHWPGNVRLLSNDAATLIAHNLIGAEGGVPASIQRRFAVSPPAEVAAPPSKRAPGPPSDEEIMRMMEEHKFNITAAAKALGMAKNTLTRHIKRIEDLPYGPDLTAAMITAALEAEEGNPPRAALRLRVSSGALAARMKALGIQS